MLKFGYISDRDPELCRVRVQFDAEGIVSHWLPVIVPAAGDNYHFRMPNVNDHVVCLMDDFAENGAVIGAIFDRSNPSGETINISAVEFADGTRIEHDSGQNKLTITKSPAELSIQSAGVGVTRGGESLKTVLTDLVAQIELLTVASFGTPPVNVAAFTAIKTRITNLLN